MPLAGAPDLRLAAARPVREAGLGLDVRLVDRRGPVVLLHDLVGLGEARVEIADLEADPFRDVRRALGGGVHPARDHVIEQQRGVLGHRLLHVDDVRQHLVVHVDESQRPVRDGDADRGHRGHRMALVERLLARHDVAGDVPEVDRQPLGARVCEGMVGQVRAGDHRLHPRQGRGPRGVDGADAGVRVRAAQHLPVEHSGQVVIGAELRGPRDLRHPVGAHRPGTDPLEGLLRLGHPGLLGMAGGTHGAGASSRAAAPLRRIVYAAAESPYRRMRGGARMAYRSETRPKDATGFAGGRSFSIHTLRITPTIDPDSGRLL